VQGTPVTAGKTPRQVFQEARQAFGASSGPREQFLKANNLAKDTIVHHRVELQTLEKYPGLFTAEELNAQASLRGVPKSINSEVHLSQIRKEWNAFYRQVDADAARGIPPSREAFLRKAAEIDQKFGKQFTPPVK